MKQTQFQKELERTGCFDNVEFVGEVIIGRHAVAKRKPDGKGSLDELDDKILDDGKTTVTHKYEHGLRHNRFVRANKLSPANSFIEYSGKERTKYTGIGTVAGAFRAGGFSKPSNVGDLENVINLGKLHGLRISQNPALDMGDGKFNMEHFAKRGEAGYMADWVQNPSSNTLGGEEITPYNEFLGRGDYLILKALDHVKNGRTFGAMIGHGGGMAACAHMAANNVDNPDTTQNMQAMGGDYNMEDYSALRFYRVSRGGNSTLVASISRQTKDGKPINGREQLVSLSRVKEDLKYRIESGQYTPKTEDARQLAFAE